MYPEATQILIAEIALAFLVGWIVGKLGARIGMRRRLAKRDPRDNKIRSLEAEHRIAKLDVEKVRQELAQLKLELDEEQSHRAERDKSLQEQADMVKTLRQDLKDSVIKTRQLRTELTDRAEENVKSEVKLREVETELSVAHASTDLIATGVLDYSLAPEPEEPSPAKKLKSGKPGS